ncbi:hypothetical protein ACO0RG_001962 [Hanseniaspora osmophila]|uniref:Transcription initiation factor IIA subunit 2 n=1 Tax=Hanseniaspora osmophila TaxID=56408 RepID=A0A1E5RHZ6_9ASCO|nr:Transcription initiation factor IIA subunit 2 [Hanseniaspora osmophila]
MSTSTHYELYRRSTVGSALVDALDNLISEGRIEAGLAMRCLEVFDKVVSETLKDKTASKMTIKGHLHTYRFCDDVWTFIIKNCELKLEHITDLQSGSKDDSQPAKETKGKNSDINTEIKTLECEKLRIVACNARKSAD